MAEKKGQTWHGLTKTERLWGKIDQHGPDECWPYRGGRSGGYGSFWNGETVTHAHREVWISINGSIRDGLFVLHKCDNRICCNPAHLFLGTNADNMEDMRHKGRRKGMLLGDDNGRAVLMAQQVVLIRQRFDNGISSVSALADEYKVWRTTIRDIVNRVTWKGQRFEPFKDSA